MFVVPAVWLSRHAVSKPSMVLAISGPATFHRSRALGFCVKPIALPSALTTALFCSCASSIAMAEKGRVDLCTTKLPRSNYFATSGSRSCSVVISRIYIYRNPARIVCVVQGKEPWSQCSQCSGVEGEVSFAN